MCGYQQFFINKLKNKQMKTLKLTLNKKWFDLIEKGIKTEEYREIKDYWIKRIKEMSLTRLEAFKHFDLVEFTNGYNKTSPQITMECKGIEVGTGKTEWGAVADTQYFVIKLGREVGRQNC
jgi:hypothetical protein